VSTGGAPAGGVSSTSTAKTGGATSVGGAGTSTGTGTGGVGTGGIASTSTGGTTTNSSGVGGGSSVTDAGPVGLDLFVPLIAENTGTDFEVDYGGSSGSASIDMSDTIITAKVCVETDNTAGTVRLYAKTGAPGYVSVYSDWDAGKFDTFTSGCHDITLDLSATAAADASTAVFDKSKVRFIGFAVANGGTFSGAVFGNVTVTVETITFSDGARADYTFNDSSAQGFAINANNAPVAGSKINGV